jgi:hypothetical protein
MPDRIPFVWTDAWLFHAILISVQDGEAPLDVVISAADGIQHAMLIFDEIDGGIARLTRAGLIEIRNRRFHLTPAGTELRSLVATRSVRKSELMLRKKLGAADPEPPYKPTPADPAWTSGAFTIEDVKKAEKAYRRRVREWLRRR